MKLTVWLVGGNDEPLTHGGPMKRKERRTFTPQQRLEIVLEGLQDGASVSEVCRRHQVSPTVYYRWRDLLFANADRIFTRRDPGPTDHEAAYEVEAGRLKSVIAEITAENLELKKTVGPSRTPLGFRRSSGR
ncbi:MAG: transposase [Gemmatimonadetes bacterium]|nr:transposase [Gemmatimonadota bacterium]